MLGVQPAWSGNTVLAVDRITEDGTAVFAGELLQPGEVVLTTGDTYTTPWIVITACNDGLDGVAHSLHAWERSLPAHPVSQPVTLNVWEALYFDQDPDVVLDLVGRAARLGVERFVLDDGWFHARRTDTAGLGDWWVDRSVDYVKWDHNRDLLEAGTNTRGGAPAVHEQTVAYYRLLDTLRGRFPNIQWESCASGGGRIDLGVIEHVERVWTSDMTDALSRQRIQPWRVAACPRPGPEGALPAAVGGAGGRRPRGRIAGGVPPRLGSSAGVGPVGSGRHHHRRGLGHDRRAHPPLPSRDDPSDRDRAGLIRNNEGPVGGRSSNTTIPRPPGLRLRHPDQPVFWRPAATPDTVHRMR